MPLIYKNGIIELIIKCPECGKKIVLFKNGKETEEKYCTYCNKYEIDILHVKAIKKILQKLK